MTGWLTDPGDLVAGLVVVVASVMLGVSFMQSILEGVFFE